MMISTLLAFGCASSTKEQDPDKALLHLRLGTSFLNAGQYPSAYRELKKALELDSENKITHNQIALTYYARERYKLSEYHLKKALEIDPGYSDARNNLGRLYIEQGRYKEAIIELEKVVGDLKYHNPLFAHVNLGMAYMKNNQHEKAQAVLTKAIRLNRTFCPAHSLYGRSLYENGEFYKATTALDKASNLCEGLDESRYFSALSHIRIGKTAQAIARLEEIVELTPNSPYINKTRALLRKLRQ